MRVPCRASGCIEQVGGDRHRGQVAGDRKVRQKDRASQAEHVGCQGIDRGQKVHGQGGPAVSPLGDTTWDAERAFVYKRLSENGLHSWPGLRRRWALWRTGRPTHPPKRLPSHHARRLNQPRQIEPPLGENVSFHPALWLR